MRVVLQRVSRAKCEVAGRVTGEVGLGFLALVGFTEGDDDNALAKMAKKSPTSAFFPMTPER